MEEPPLTADFAKDLEGLLNRHSQENGSNTPDFILADYLLACLAAWNRGVEYREKWYGRPYTGPLKSVMRSVDAPLLRELVGFLSAAVPELHHVEIPRLIEALDRFLVASALSPSEPSADQDPYLPNAGVGGHTDGTD